MIDAPGADTAEPTAAPQQPTANDQAATYGLDDWQSAAEILDQLDRLAGREAQKKRDTVLALVDARLAGRSEETVWRLPQTCNRSIYHSKWKKDPTFADVLRSCTTVARRQRDTRAARSIANAAERLALASRIAAERLTGLLDSTDENVIRLAAIAILDRAGMETAAKGETLAVTASLDDWRRDAEQRRAAVETMLAEWDATEPAAEPDQQQESTGQ